MSRRNELDAFRGLLLLIMVATHLPTRLRTYVDQPFGFVSAAEGFVFLAAFVAGEGHASRSQAHGTEYARVRLWERAYRVYGYHLALLAFAFTVVAAFAGLSGRPGPRNLLSFYFESPLVAVLGGPVLLYQPPLLDILPMYIVFLALSPSVLEHARRRGWLGLAAGSLLLWGFAQFGGRLLVHSALCTVTGIAMPVDATGSFDLFAWQLLWLAGLWAGSRCQRGLARTPAPWPWLVTAGLLACGFCIWRHRLGGFWVDLGTHGAWLDKWHLGGLRLLNFAVLALLVSQVLLPALRHLRLGVLALLGRASLQAFAVHVLLCLASLALVVDDETPLSSAEEVAVVSITVVAMLAVAWRAAPRGGNYPQARERALAGPS